MGSGVGRAGVLALIMSSLPLAAAPAGAAPDMEPERAIQMLNEWRAAVGVAPVSHDPEQSEGCRLHAAYYGLTGHTGHKEELSSPGYTEAGHKAAGSSVLTYGGGADGPYAWENAVYHRTSLLDPKLATSGFWAEHGLGCMGVFGEDENRRAPELEIYPYPYDGQQGVVTTFVCNETPNPCEMVPGNDGEQPTGFIPSVQFNGPWESFYGPLVSTAQLVPDGGAPVAITVEDDDSGLGSYLDEGFDLIPHKPLAAGTWYTASAIGVLRTYTSSEEGTETLVPFSVNWRFQTQVVPPPFSNPDLNVTMLRGKARISSRNPNPITLTMQRGRSKRQTKTLELRPAGRGTFARVIPARIRSVHWRVCARQAKQLEERWNRGQDCEHGAPMGLASTVLWSNRTFVRLRIKAPSLTHGRKATVLLLGPGGSVLDRARVTLTEKSRVDLSGPAGSRAVAVHILVRRFVRQGIPRRVLPETIRLSEVAKRR